MVTEGVKQHVTTHNGASKESPHFTYGSKRCDLNLNCFKQKDILSTQSIMGHLRHSLLACFILLTGNEFELYGSQTFDQ